MSDLSIFHSSPNFFDDSFFSELEIEAATTFKNQTSSSISHQTIDSNQPKTISDNDEYKETQSSHNSKRKLFTKEEDKLLTTAAISFQYESWNKIAKFVPGKTPKQCRDRWVNYLQPSLNFEPWSNSEDQLLVSLVNTHGTHWSKMKKNFPNRSTNSIKNRWYWLLKNNINAVPIDNTMICDLNNTSSNIFMKNSMNLNNNINGMSSIQMDLDRNNVMNSNVSVVLCQPKNKITNYYYFLRNTYNDHSSNKKCCIKNKKNKNTSKKSNENNFEIFADNFGDDDSMLLNFDEYEW